MEFDKDRRPIFIRRILKNKKTVTGMVLFLIGYLLVFVSIYIRSLPTLDAHTFGDLLIRWLPYIFAIVGAGYFLFGYLEGTESGKQPDKMDFNKFQNVEQVKIDLREYFEELRHAQERNRRDTVELMERFRHEFEQQKELHLDENQRKELFNSLKQSFSENINEEFFKELSENVSTEITKEKRGRLDLLLRDFSSIKARLGSEIEKLSRKANVNLVIGSLTTIVALMALGVIVFQSSGDFKSYPDMLYHYIPRLSLIIFIEVFAYFFLRLYKLNLNDMKYFQNELTTVELKLSSITTAINFGKDTDISAITIELAKTERNFILKKDETTVDLEKSRIDKTDFKELLKSMTDIINKGK